MKEKGAGTEIDYGGAECLQNRAVGGAERGKKEGEERKTRLKKSRFSSRITYLRILRKKGEKRSQGYFILKLGLTKKNSISQPTEVLAGQRGCWGFGLTR